jgi:hypothetical protein
MRADDLEKSGAMQVKKGMRITWRPQWCDRGDENYTFVAISDEGLDGDFRVATVESTLFVRPWSSARAHMVERAEPWLPVATFVFLGLKRKGAHVELRRTRGDAVVSVTVETIARGTFRATFRKGVADCKIGEVLLSEVEFPKDAR